MQKMIAFILLLLFLGNVSGLAQTTKLPELSIAYFGELGLHIGAVAGIEYPLLSTSRSVKDWQYQLKGTGRIGIFHQPKSHQSVFVTIGLAPEIQYHRQKKNGESGLIFMGLGGGIGGLHAFLQGKIYERTETGVDSRSMGGSLAWVVPTRLYFGGKLYNTGTKDVLWYASFDNLLEYPSKGMVVHHPSLELGIKFGL